MESSRWSTHATELGATTVVKRFRPENSDGHAREWRALTLLAEHAPGLAPTPLRSHPGAGRTGCPTVVMSRLPGTPLRGTPVTVRRTEALAEAVRYLYAAVPAEVVEKLPVRTDEQTAVIGRIHTWHRALRTSGAAPEVEEALSAGLTWLVASNLERRGPGDVPPVFGPGDGNLANYLWDGSRVRIVDFEVSGRSDRALEVAEITEHVSSWTDGGLDVDLFLSLIDLTPAETTRLLDCRRLLALVWLCMLALDRSDPPRNPPGTAERQAHRLLRLLG